MYCDIAVDDSCRPHISYDRGFHEERLGYATWTGSEWHIAVADSIGRVGHHTSIALDALSLPHISYREIGAGCLRYAHWTGTEWETDIVDTSPGVGFYTSIALDDSGRPHIAYWQMSGGNLKYARLDTGGWHIEKVDSLGSVGAHTSLALQFGMKPFISYMDVENSDLKLARGGPSSWEFEKVDTLGNVGMYTSIAVHTDGDPQIAYMAWDVRKVKLAKWTGSDWRTEVVDPGTNASDNVSLALDSYGFAHILYKDEDFDALKHAYWDGSAWSVELVDDGGKETGMFKSVAIDRENNIHIAYCACVDTTIWESELRYARREPTALTESALAEGDSDIRLFQNKPNPFNNSTIIFYSLPQATEITLSIYDLSGRLVETLVNESQESDIHQIRWNRKNRPSGVYFCTLKAGEVTDTKKMVVVE